jgi:uncharacterized protein YaiE (UPF0345 family)
MSSIPSEFVGVTAVTRANIYFEGKVVSHALVFPDGSRRTLGIVFPGTFHFGTVQAELMQVVAGQCLVKLDGGTDWATYGEGDAFGIAANSGFEIVVEEGTCQYICSFLD